MSNSFDPRFYHPPNFFRPGLPKRWYRPGTVYRYVFKEGEYRPIVITEDGMEKEVIWAPTDGSISAFLSCSDVEVLLEGNRGGAKTTACLMDYYQHVNKGYGAEWRGILFRQSHPQLENIIKESKRWFRKLSAGARYNEIKYFWEFPQGERLYFSHFDGPSDFDKYIGQGYSWICWDELTRWQKPDGYLQMFSCLRSSRPGMPRKMRATTNPYGVGHTWVQKRFNLYQWPRMDEKGRVIVLGDRIEGDVDEKTGVKQPTRRAIHNDLHENKVFLKAQPDYISNLIQSARNESERKAWLEGSWDVTAGGMFDDIWGELQHVIVINEELIGGPLEIPLHLPIFRAYDHGSGKPYSVGFYVICDGTDLLLPNGKVRSTVRGDLIRIGEVYGWSGQDDSGLRLPPAEIVRSIVRYEIKRGWRPADGSTRGRVKPGPADLGIFDDVNGVCIANDMEKPIVDQGVRHKGLFWEHADKGPGSREQGWEQLRKRLFAVKRPDLGYRETPGLFIYKQKGIINHWIRTVPTLQRDEEKNIDDVADGQEDHCGDECRYALRFEYQPMISRRV